MAAMGGGVDVETPPSLSHLVAMNLEYAVLLCAKPRAGVELPVDGLAPQPIVPVIDGFSCRLCRFLTIYQFVVRKHANRKHSKQGEEAQAGDNTFGLGVGLVTEVYQVACGAQHLKVRYITDPNSYAS